MFIGKCSDRLKLSITIGIAPQNGLQTSSTGTLSIVIDLRLYKDAIRGVADIFVKHIKTQLIAHIGIKMFVITPDI